MGPSFYFKTPFPKFIRKDLPYFFLSNFFRFLENKLMIFCNKMLSFFLKIYFKEYLEIK